MARRPRHRTQPPPHHTDHLPGLAVPDLSVSAAPRLSVVVPTYNRRAGIVRLLQALAEQTLPPDQFEVVVANDGSTDGTAEALASYRAPYRLTVLTQATGAVDFGIWSPLVAGALAVATNWLRLWAQQD